MRSFHHNTQETPSVLSMNYPENKVYVNGKPYLKVQNLGKGGSSHVFKVINPQGEVFALKEVDVIQLEINSKYRDPNNIELLEKLISSLEKFIKQYSEYIKR